MGINRRQCLAIIGAGLLAPITGQAQNAPFRLASAATDKAGQHWLQLFDSQGQSIIKHALPARAHHVAIHPNQQWLMAVARRPDQFIDIVDIEHGKLLKRLISGTSRHFFGHATFSNNGRWLACSENDLVTNQGRIVIRDCHNNFITVADMPSYGIGPHELLWANDQQTIIVANGGILTHPDKGRAKLNLATMKPSLSYINSHTGQLIEQAELPAPLHQLSIRHIAVNQQDTVAIAMQYQGALSDSVPLIATHQRGQAIQLLEQPEVDRQKMKQYCGSVRFDKSGQYFAVSAPRGNLVSFWKQNGQYMNTVRVADGCGITATHNAAEFLMSSGNGKLYRYNLASGHKMRLHLGELEQLAWDNHLSLTS